MQLQPPAPRIGSLPLPSPPQRQWVYREGMLSPTSPALQVNAVLRRPASNQPMPFYYDMTRPPSSIIFACHSSPLGSPSAVLFERATQPSMSRMQLIVPTIGGGRLPVVVAYNPEGVTVIDVLSCIYDALRSPIGPSVTDEHLYPSSHARRQLQPRSRSYEDQLPGASGDRPRARRNVDQLEGRTIFAGLEEHSDFPNTWIVKTTSAT
ncbi:hypothetical protein M422DRAFT_782928 [Sphaerobolus stellatus SS14]|uniref:DUF6699 domain-containing protein n=1 Tax=Sphaerobolus stellatus (strain SS14) TaxID=990650 RepID=A0A0C9TVC0_SPHS4|nr:hypothetical protein M422DRAFT_782928 [Sphaerobolus stellatus SS14]